MNAIATLMAVKKKVVVVKERVEKANASGTVKVCVRVRPFIKEETEGTRNGAGPLECCITMDSESSMTITGQRKGQSGDMVSTLDFDRCFWSHTREHPLFADQASIYEEFGTNLLGNIIEGYNNCLFAYGQTGSGKSFSILGDNHGENAGLLPRMVMGAFEQFAEQEEMIFKCVVSCLEIYQENIADLLLDDEALRKKAQKSVDATKLNVREHPEYGTFIPGLTEVAVGSQKEVMDLLDYAMSVRHVAETAMNATSSRSHCIFTFKTSVSKKGDDISKMSQTHIVDLAGSERAARTAATGDRLKEGASINQSLSALALVISELTSKAKTVPPFRTSKLTHILKESLCGNSKTIMMAALSPSARDYAETMSTLKFAQSVKLVQTKAKVNAVSEKAIDAKMQHEVQELQAKLKELQNDKHHDQQRISEMQRQLLDSKDHYQHTTNMFGSHWEETLQKDRLRFKKRVGLLQESVAGADLDFLLALNKKMEDERGSDSGSISSASEIPEDHIDHPDQAGTIHIRLDDISLDDLRTSMRRLASEADEFAGVVNGSLEPTAPQVRLTPMLALGLDGGSLQFMVKSEMMSGVSTTFVVNGQGVSEKSNSKQEEWISEADFLERFKKLKAWTPKKPRSKTSTDPLSAALEDKSNDGDDTDTLASPSSGDIWGDMSAQQSNAVAVSSKATCQPSSSSQEELGSPAPAVSSRGAGQFSSREDMSAQLQQSKALVEDLRAQLREARLRPSSREDLRAQLTEAPRPSSGSQDLRSAAASTQGEPDPPPLDALDAEPDETPPGRSAEEIQRKKDEFSKRHQDSNTLKVFKSAKPVHGYTWNRDSPGKKKIDVDLRPGAGTPCRKKQDTVGTPSTPCGPSTPSTPSPRKLWRGTKYPQKKAWGHVPRSSAFHWVKSLSDMDPESTSFEEALVGKSPAITLLEALKDRRVADTVKDDIVSWPGISGSGGSESVEAALEILWKGGFLEESVTRRRSYSTPATPSKKPRAARASRANQEANSDRSGSVPSTPVRARRKSALRRPPGSTPATPSGNRGVSPASTRR